MEKVTAEKLVAYREHLQANEEYKDLDTRFAWDILHSCDQAKKARLFDKSYHQDLFDNHIGTAIRHIVKSFLKKQHKEGSIMKCERYRTMKQESNEKYMDVQMILYDVWGNKKDGYTVNDIWKVDEPITINEEIWWDHKALRKIIKKYLFKPEVRLGKITITFQEEIHTEFEFDNKPCGRLEVVKEYEQEE